MTSLLLVVGIAWLVVSIARAFRPKRSEPPKILRHTLSDKEDMIIVTVGDQFWVGTYRRDETPTEGPETPDWYRSLRN